MNEFFIDEYATVVEAMMKIDQNARGMLVVTDKEMHLKGILTDGDIRRWLIDTGDLQGKVGSIMNKQPKVVTERVVYKAHEYMNAYAITAIPVITVENRVIDIIFKNEMDGQNAQVKGRLLEVPVVIMAGGKGTRLYPYTKILPKPLIPIGDIPIVERIMNAFGEYGVKKFFLTINYKKEMIKTYFSDIALDYCVNYIEEQKPLGTAGSLKLLENKMKDSFILTNCDILIQADYADVYQYHKKMKNDITIVTALKNITIPYGVVYSGENGKIAAMEEKPSISYLINTGMYVLNSDLIRMIPDDTFFHMTDLIDRLIKEKYQVGMYPISEDSFLDMGEIEEMHRMEEKLQINLK